MAACVSLRVVNHEISLGYCLYQYMPYLTLRLPAKDTPQCWYTYKDFMIIYFLSEFVAVSANRTRWPPMPVTDTLSTVLPVTTTIAIVLLPATTTLPTATLVTSSPVPSHVPVHTCAIFWAETVHWSFEMAHGSAYGNLMLFVLLFCLVICILEKKSIT